MTIAGGSDIRDRVECHHAVHEDVDSSDVSAYQNHQLHVDEYRINPYFQVISFQIYEVNISYKLLLYNILAVKDC